MSDNTRTDDRDEATATSGEGQRSLAMKLNRMFDTETTNVWERWEGETDTEFERFCMFRDMPPSARSIRQVATRVDVNGSQMYATSQKWKWRSRASAWDKYRDNQKTKAEVTEIVAMRRRHVNMARAMQAMVDDWIMEKMVERDSGIPVALTPSEAVKMLEASVKLEVNSIDTETAEDNDLTALSSEELILYTNLRHKIAKGNNNDNDN